jgi:hypothetical protein
MVFQGVFWLSLLRSVIPAKAGIQKRTFRRNASPFFDWPPFWLEKTHWIPAFAGMTV